MGSSPGPGELPPKVGLGPILEDSTNKNVEFEANKNGEDLSVDLSH